MQECNMLADIYYTCSDYIIIHTQGTLGTLDLGLQYMRLARLVQ